MSDTGTSGDQQDPERTGSGPRPGASAQSSAAVPAPDGARNGTGPDARDARDSGPSAEASADKPAREKPSSDWFAPRKAPPATPAAGTPVVPPAAAGSSGPSGGAAGSGPNPPRPESPYFSDSARHPGDPGAPQSGGSALDGFGADGPGGPRFTPDPGARTPGPSGPTTGPATGSSSLTPNLDGIPGMGAGPVGPGGPVGPRGPGGPGPAGPGGSGPGGPGGMGMGMGMGMGAGMGGPGAGGPGGPGGVPPRMSDDTTVLRPQLPAPEPHPGHVSGDTLTSGIPVVPPETRTPFPGGPGTPGGPRAGMLSDSPTGSGPAGSAASAQAPTPRPAPKAAAPAKKGRSKLVLLCVAVFALLAVAYGAGLLMNHSEVPKGTTVLGADIGGGTKAEAVTKLEAAFGKRAQAPMQLSVDGKKAELLPEKAGLSLDSQETVRGAAGSDYNPVSVIGSLFGGERPADPVIPVDEEKLGAALTDLAGVSGSSDDGTIKFEPNKAVAVPGKAGKALDVNQSLLFVRDAYRAQVQTGKPAVVELPVTTSEPTIDQAELDRSMKRFAEPAMSGLITIKAGPKEIQFGPAKSLPQILSMKPVDGKLVEVYDTKAIDTLLDGVFDGIMITKGDGKQQQVSADDVARAMRSALLGKTPVERTATIDLGGGS